jgi:hypothetical protein
MRLVAERIKQDWTDKTDHETDPANYLPEPHAKLIWKPPVYRTVWAILTNPLYAGAYVYGRREVRTHIVEGRVRKSKGHRKSRAEWSVFIREHHSGYRLHRLTSLIKWHPNCHCARLTSLKDECDFVSESKAAADSRAKPCRSKFDHGQRAPCPTKELRRAA